MSKTKFKSKKTYLIRIIYKRTACPVCHTIGNFKQDNELLLCQTCGCVINDPYPYSAGIKHSEGIRFTQKIIYPMEDTEK